MATQQQTVGVAKAIRDLVNATSVLITATPKTDEGNGPDTPVRAAYWNKILTGAGGVTLPTTGPDAGKLKIILGGEAFEVNNEDLPEGEKNVDTIEFHIGKHPFISNSAGAPLIRNFSIAAGGPSNAVKTSSLTGITTTSRLYTSDLRYIGQASSWVGSPGSSEDMVITLQSPMTQAVIDVLAQEGGNNGYVISGTLEAWKTSSLLGIGEYTAPIAVGDNSTFRLEEILCDFRVQEPVIESPSSSS